MCILAVMDGLWQGQLLAREPLRCSRANALSGTAGLGKIYPSIMCLALADLYGFLFSVEGELGHHIPAVGTK